MTCTLIAATALTDLDTPTINKLLTALNECTEWGQVFILDSLAGYEVLTHFSTLHISLASHLVLELARDFHIYICM